MKYISPAFDRVITARASSHVGSEGMAGVTGVIVGLIHFIHAVLGIVVEHWLVSKMIRLCMVSN
jgi:hypothetical protein